MKHDANYCPCKICDVKMTCETDCLEFKKYLSTDKVEKQIVNFNLFAVSLGLKL